jgi:Uma2 family endonuclease
MAMPSSLHQLPDPAVDILRKEEWESHQPPMDSDLHREQIMLLIACLRWWWRNRRNYYVTGNMTIFFSGEEKTTEQFRGPDFFVVLNADPRPRKSWMVWREGGKYPNLIIELLSDSTAKQDRTEKKQVYQDTFQTPEYFWFHPVTLEFEAFRLREGTYEPIPPSKEGWRWSQQLELYVGIHESQLRFFSPEGVLLPSPEERAEQAEQQLEKLQQRLQDLGLEP